MSNRATPRAFREISRSIGTGEAPYVLFFLACLPVFYVATLSALHAAMTPDDSYYYFAIARELVEHGRLSFDGTSLASGFHPLWLALCALVYMVAGDALPRAIGMVSFACYAGYALFWYLTLRRLDIAPRARLAFFGFAVLNAPVALMAFSGMEVPLALLGGAAFACALVRDLDDPASAAWRTCLATVLLFLARLDSLVYVAPALLWLFVRAPRRRFLPMAGVALVVLAYMGWSLAVFGSPVPSSTGALRLLWYPAWLARETPWAHTGYFIDFPSHLVVAVRSAYWDAKTALGVAGNIFNLGWPAHLLTALLAGLAALGFRRRAEGIDRARPPGRTRDLRWLAAMLAVGIAVYLYASVVRLGGPREWYLQTPAFLTVAAAALAVSTMRRPWSPPAALVAAQIAVYALTVPGLLANDWLPLHRAEAAAAAEKLVAPAKIGAFNAGVYGWQVPGVINLDGLVNQDAYEAIRTRTLAAYLKRADIRYILDVDGAAKIRALIAARSRQRAPRLTVVREWPDANGFVHRLYRLD